MPTPLKEQEVSFGPRLDPDDPWIGHLARGADRSHAGQATLDQRRNQRLAVYPQELRDFDIVVSDYSTMSEVPSQSRPILLSAEKTAAPRRARALPKTPLALAVLNLLSERAMHPYEMKSMMIERGHLRAIRLKDASLYDTVERLATLGFIESIGVRREGRRPERTVYSITQSGRDELLMWMQELVSTPSREYPSFAAALMFIYALGRDKAIAALAKRGALLEGEISRIDTYQKALATDLAAVYAEMLQRRSTEFPRLFRVEEEYAQAMRRAELAWIRQTIRDLRDGTLPWPDLGGPEESDQ